MGFRRPGDGASIIAQLRALAAAARDSRNDGWTASSCKHEIYLVKCYLDEIYSDLPTFSGEEEWEKERLIEILKR